MQKPHLPTGTLRVAGYVPRRTGEVTVLLISLPMRGGGNLVSERHGMGSQMNSKR